MAILTIGAAGCGGGDGDGGSGGAAGDAEDVVIEWVEGWARASGVTRDAITAQQMRRFLTGDLLAQVEGLVAGGEALQLGQEGGSGATKRIDTEYNKMVGLTIPPNEKPPLTITESTLGGDGESATIVVTLHYSDSAAASASATGLFPAERVAEVQAELAAAPPKTFTVVKVEGDWKISAIN
jgi:hypothetical protein